MRWTLIALIWTACATPLDALAQPAPQADPRDLGLLIPNAPPQPGGDRRVLVKNLQDQVVVGEVHVEIGDRFIVLLPNGRLISVLQREATVTDRPFVPVTKEELLEELTGSAFRGFKTSTTRRYVYVYNTSDAFFQGTSRILETMYPALYAYCERQDIEVHEPRVPLVMIMFRTEEAYRKYRQIPAEIVAYYNGVNNYVVMYEQSELAKVAPTLAVKRSISTIAHEGVHQILHNIGVQQRLATWPMWISEGLPEFFAPTTIDRRIRWKGVGIVNDLRMYNLGEYLKQQPPEAANGGLIRRTVAATTLDANGYAASWALTHYLAKRHRENFFAFLRAVSERQALGEPSKDNAELFREHFGDDLAGMQKGMLSHLQKLPYVNPITNQPHYVAALDLGNRRTVMITTSPNTIARWQQQALQSLTPAQRAAGRLNVRVFENKALAEQAAQRLLGG